MYIISNYSGIDEARFGMAAAPTQFSSSDPYVNEETPLAAKFSLRWELNM